MRALWKIIKQNPLNIATIVVFIFPFLPLSFFAIIGSVTLVIKFVEGLSGIVFGSNFDLELLLLFPWFVGGVAGVVGAVLVIFNQRNLKSLLLINAGLISYLILLFFGFSQKGFPSLDVTYAPYLIFAAIVVLIHIVQIAKELYQQRLPFVVIKVDDNNK